jgi:hypothetical protein
MEIYPTKNWLPSPVNSSGTHSMNKILQLLASEVILRNFVMCFMLWYASLNST